MEDLNATEMLLQSQIETYKTQVSRFLGCEHRLSSRWDNFIEAPSHRE